MGIYNVTSNMTNYVDVAVFTNNISGGYLGELILFVVGAVSLFVTSTFQAKDSMVSSGFVVFATALLLRYIGILSQEAYIFSIVLLIIGAAFSFFSKGGSQGA